MHPERNLELMWSSRRRFLRQLALAGAATSAVPGIFAAETITLPFENGERQIVSYPQKRPLIRHTTRPPQLETPFSVFNEGVITPNDAFFVRYHLSNIPLEIDPATFRLEIKGAVEKPLSLSLEEIKTGFERTEIVAVCQCSGNSRGFFQPRVGGGQLGNGAMGNALWTGVRLKHLLNKAGIKAGATQVSFNGLDTAVNEKTPDFVKALEMDQAMDGEVMLAYAMNGDDLPMLNGFPLRLVVPGYYGTYWVKHLNEITVLDKPFEGFWVNTAYRIPDTEGACVPPGTTPGRTIPIARYNVRSFITNLKDGQTVKAGTPIELRGIAFDGGHGITEVLISSDAGKSWQACELGKDLGKYSFRQWSTTIKFDQPGSRVLRVRASNTLGQSQPMEPLWNPAGYMRNVSEAINLQVAS